MVEDMWRNPNEGGGAEEADVTACLVVSPGHTDNVLAIFHVQSAGALAARGLESTLDYRTLVIKKIKRSRYRYTVERGKSIYISQPIYNPSSTLCTLYLYLYPKISYPRDFDTIHTILSPIHPPVYLAFNSAPHHPSPSQTHVSRLSISPKQPAPFFPLQPLDLHAQELNRVDLKKKED